MPKIFIAYCVSLLLFSSYLNYYGYTYSSFFKRIHHGSNTRMMGPHYHK